MRAYPGYMLLAPGVSGEPAGERVSMYRTARGEDVDDDERTFVLVVAARDTTFEFGLAGENLGLTSGLMSRLLRYGPQRTSLHPLRPSEVHSEAGDSDGELQAPVVEVPLYILFPGFPRHDRLVCSS
jgi:hypothetical protein